MLLGPLGKTRLPRIFRYLTGAGVITSVELLTGLLANRQYQIWDYRQMPFHFYGQICLPYSLLWIPVSAGAMGIYSLLCPGDEA